MILPGQVSFLLIINMYILRKLLKIRDKILSAHKGSQGSFYIYVK